MNGKEGSIWERWAREHEQGLRRPTPFQGTPSVRAELPTLPEARDTDPAPPPIGPDWDALIDGD